VEQLIDEVVDMPGALPLVSFALSELYLKYLNRQWEAQNQGLIIERTLTQEDYQELGGVIQSLTQRADEEYEALVKEDEIYAQIIPHVMLRMVALGTGELARRRVPLSELEYPLEENNFIKEVIQRFTKARLLVIGQNAEGNIYVEPAHDALVRGWPRLSDWIRNEPGRIALQHNINNDASLWDKARLNKNEAEAVGYLWNDDPRLEEAKEKNWLNKLEKEFVEKSVKQKEYILERTQQQRDEAIQGEIKALSALSEARFQNDELGALTSILKAGRRLQELKDSRWLNKELLESSTVVLVQTLGKVQECNRLEGRHRGGISQVDFSHDGKMIATVDCFGQVILWKQDGSLFNILSGYPVAFSPNSQMIATGQGNTVTLRNTDDTGFKILPECRGQVSAIAFSTDGNMIATASKEEGNTLHEIVQLWNIEDSTLLTTLEGGMHEQLAVAFSPDGKMIASVGWHGAKLWNLHDATGKTLEGHSQAVVAVSFSPDNEMIATASVDATVKLWNKDGTCLNTLQEHRDGVWGVSFSPDGEMIATGGQDTTVKLWNKDGTLLKTLSGHQAKVNSVRFSPDGQLLASASDDGTVKLWQLSGTSLKILGEHTDVVYAVGFSPNGEMIATTSGHGLVNLWKPDGTLVKSEKWHCGPASTLDFSPNGQMMVTVAGDRTVKLSKLDGTDGQLLEGHTGERDQREVLAVSFSRDSQMIVLGNVEGTIELWNSDGTRKRTFSGHQDAVWGISFSPDDQMFATASNDGKVKLWNRDGSLVKTLWHSSPLLKVAFSPDLDPLNQIIAAAGADGTVKLWNRNGTELKTLKGHKDVVSAVCFSPDGQLIASASYDKTVKLWNRDGSLHKTLYGHNDQVKAVAFSPDGKTIASASSDKTVILWRLDLALDLDELLNYGCDWVRDYLNNNSNGSSDRKLCDEVPLDPSIDATVPSDQVAA
jgi:WD40 repeat protein